MDPFYEYEKMPWTAIPHAHRKHLMCQLEVQMDGIPWRNDDWVVWNWAAIAYAMPPKPHSEMKVGKKAKKTKPKKKPGK